jgi:hypothetical protein
VSGYSVRGSYVDKKTKNETLVDLIATSMWVTPPPPMSSARPRAPWGCAAPCSTSTRLGLPTAARLPCHKAILDGEVIAQGANGVSDYGALRDTIEDDSA